MTRRIHITLLTLVLVLYGCWSISAAARVHLWSSVVGGLLALVAAAGVVKSKRWSSFVVYIIAVVFSAEWLWYIWVIHHAGYFSTIPFARVVVSLVPGVALMVVAGYCCYVAWRYVSEGPARPNSRWSGP
jgi:hypothetical protein